jgi:large subunit ribosomal protein L17
MNHNRKGKKLGRVYAQRKALMRNLAESIVLYGGIRTTVAKAKALRPVIEPLVTRAIKGTVADRRQIMRVLYTKNAVNKLIHEIAPTYKDRNGGYTRIIKLGNRHNDGAAMARIEFV